MFILLPANKILRTFFQSNKYKSMSLLISVKYSLIMLYDTSFNQSLGGHFGRF